MKEAFELKFVDGSSKWIMEDDPDVSYVVRVEGGKEILLYAGTFEEASQKIIDMGNLARGIKIQPYPPQEDSE